MKKLTVVMIFFALIAGCSGNKTEQEKTEPTEAQNASTEFQQASQKLIGSFGKALKGELLAAMNEGGPVAAINTCAQSAPEIAAQFSNEAITIRRVSDKNRNPQNGASDHEKEIMANFATAEMPAYFEETTAGETGEVYHYYQPIKAGKLCLNCHGPKDQLDPKVVKEIEKNYPGDLAVGYAEGDLRGMFVVEMKLPEAEALVKTIVADTL